MGSLQYAWYQYKLTENMPSENAIGKQLTASQVTQLNLTQEGPSGNNKFYMQGTNSKWYEFDLVNATRSRGFFQPKVGINLNANENINVFANFAHVERMVDLGVYYNQGRLNPNVEDEKSNQFELGLGWNSKDIYMLWDNKSSYITDVSMAGQPGYDRNGNRSELIGTSQHMGIEFETGVSLDKVIPVKGFGVRGSLTYMDNTWKKILDNVKINPDGSRRAFLTTAINSEGNTYTLYFDELEGKPVASGPQFMSSLSLTYDNKGFFSSLDFSFFARDYLLDGGTFAAVDGSYIGTVNGKDLFKSIYKDQLPSRGIFDFNTGYNFNLGKKLPLKGTITLQVLNIFDTEYFSAADRSGVIPGVKRSYRANISLGW
jgi:outer membrane receptor protein involved in Fe transport